MSENQFSFHQYNFDLFVLLLFYVSLENISFNMETSPLSVRGCEMPDKSKGIFIVPRMTGSLLFCPKDHYDDKKKGTKNLF